MEAGIGDRAQSDRGGQRQRVLLDPVGLREQEGFERSLFHLLALDGAGHGLAAHQRQVAAQQ